MGLLECYINRAGFESSPLEEGKLEEEKEVVQFLKIKAAKGDLEIVAEVF